MEYYDETLHPTCADFRLASTLYLRRLFASETVEGRIADIGCGKSILLEMPLPTSSNRDLVLVDESNDMLLQNDRRRGNFEIRKLDLRTSVFGTVEFDWVFAIMADPYNTLSAWSNIGRALKPLGQCIFVVPSFTWSNKF